MPFEPEQLPDRFAEKVEVDAWCTAAERLFEAGAVAEGEAARQRAQELADMLAEEGV